MTANSGEPDAADLFRTWLAGPPKRNQADVAEQLGVAQQTVSTWTRGGIPGPIQRIKLKRLTGIPAGLWLPPEKRDQAKLTSKEEEELLALEKLEKSGGEDAA